MTIKEVKKLVTSYTQTKNKLKKLAPTFNWGNLLADYGEYVCIQHYSLKQAPIGTKGFDAKTKRNKSVQIKTVRDTTRNIRFTKGADYLLVIEVDEDAEWNEVYYGNFAKIIKASSMTKNGKYTIGIEKLKKISNNTYKPKEDIELKLKTGRKITAASREELHKKLTKMGHKLPRIETINRRINDFDWQLERAFQIKVPPNYAEVENLVEKEGYEWFPETPTQDNSRQPFVSDFEKRVYISQKYFCKEHGLKEWYVSEKKELGWDSARIIMSFRQS